MVARHVRRTTGAVPRDRPQPQQLRRPARGRDPGGAGLGGGEVPRRGPSPTPAWRSAWPAPHHVEPGVAAASELRGLRRVRASRRPAFPPWSAARSSARCSSSTRRRLDRRSREQFEQSVAESAPVIANLRNLALAEIRAATDSLTGLPNQRAAHEMIKRSAAIAGRTMESLALVLFDLDRFKTHQRHPRPRQGRRGPCGRRGRHGRGPARERLRRPARRRGVRRRAAGHRPGRRREGGREPQGRRSAPIEVAGVTRPIIGLVRRRRHARRRRRAVRPAAPGRPRPLRGEERRPEPGRDGLAGRGPYGPGPVAAGRGDPDARTPGAAAPSPPRRR